MPTQTTSYSARGPHTSGSSPPTSAARESGVKTHATFFALIGQAFHLLASRFLFYAATVAVGIGLQALVEFAVPLPHASDVAQVVVPAMLSALVYAFVWNDVQETPLPVLAAWERFLERAWAVILIDFFYSYVVALLIGGILAGETGAGALGAFAGVGAAVIAVLTIFADTAATVDDDASVLMLIPHAFARSIAAATRPMVLPRAVAILAFGLLAWAVSELLGQPLTTAHVGHVPFWASVPVNTIVTPILSALTLVVYRDATIGVGRPRE